MNKNIDVGLLVLRIALAVLMLFHGFAKLKGGVAGMAASFTENGIPGFIAYGAYVGEVIAPLMILIGFRARIAALLYAFTMLFAIFVAHSGDIFSINQFGGWAIELQMIYLLGGLTLFFTGAGKHALSTSNKWD